MPDPLLPIKLFALINSVGLQPDVIIAAYIRL